MDLDEIPEIDAVIAEPDFFGTEGAEGNSSIVLNTTQQPSLQVSQEPLLSQPGDILGGGQLVEGLKYDDELCEFNEFLVSMEGLEGGVSQTDGATSPVKTSEKVEENDKNSQGGGRDEDEKNAEASTNGRGSAMSSNSNPNTPDSRAGSAAVVHLLSFPALPKVSLASKRISSPAKDWSSTSFPTPPRMTRGRLNVPERETRSKRKLGDDDEEGGGKSVRMSRSGRQLKKNTKYGYDEEYVVANVRLGRDSDSDSITSEDMFEPVKKKKKRTPVYRTGAKHWRKDGILYFQDPHGNITQMTEVSIKLHRLTEREILQLSGWEDDTTPDDNVLSPILLEVCIDNFLSAKEAVEGGAKRIELCSSLAEGGLTPSAGFLQLVKENFPDVPVYVMIRPRGGDFLYSEDEIEIMNRDISYYKEMGADGFVFGILTEDGEVDEENCKSLLQMADPLPCTFHRAFDKVSDPLAALEVIIKLGFQRILTSGQEATAQVGIPTLKRLVETADGRIVIMAGCGVNDRNIAEIVKKTGVREVHGSASRSIVSKMRSPIQRKSNKRGSSKTAAVKMGSTDDSVIKVTDPDVVKLMVKNAKRAALS